MEHTTHGPKGQDHERPANIAVNFLKSLDPEGWHNLVAFDPKGGGPISKTFAPGNWEDIKTWVEARSGQRNLYYTANEVRAGFGNTKPRKGDIANVRALYADIDPVSGQDILVERERILTKVDEFPLQFTTVVDSGRGYQALAVLAEKRRVTDGILEWAEAHGRGLATALGGDDVQNVDRILRLPGPINIPTPHKRAAGYTEGKPAAVIVHGGPRAGVSEVEAHIVPQSSPRGDDSDAELQDVARGIEHCGFDCAAIYPDLEPELRARFERSMQDDAKLKQLWENGALIGSPDRSGSSYRFALAGRLKGKGFSSEDFAHLAFVWGYAVQAGDDRDHKLTARALARDWVHSEPVAQPACELDPLDWFEPIADESGANEAWGEPVDLFGANAPLDISVPPAGSLPDVLDRWAESESRRKGVSKAFAASAALAAVAGALGNGLKIYPRLHDTDWTVPCCLWVSLVEEPGGGKSPIISAALEPLKALDSERFKRAKPAVEKWEAGQGSRGRGKKSEPAVSRPSVPRTIVDNATMEKIISLLAENPRGLMQTPDELVQIFGSLGAYKADGAADRSQMLRLFDGGDIIVDRVGTGTKRAEKALLSILAGTQPDRIAKLAHSLGADGMLQRFLFVVGDDVDRAGGEDIAPNHIASENYADLLKFLATEDFGKAPVRLAESAYAILQAEAKKIKSLAKYPGGSTAWEGHVAKWEGILHRIALAFHAIELWKCKRAIGVVVLDTPLEQSTAIQAAAFAKFLMRHSLTFYERYFDAAPNTKAARGFAGFLLAHPEKSEFTRRDIGQAQKSLRSARDSLSAMRALEEVDWVRPIARDAEGPKRWEVNPAIHTRFKNRAEMESESRKRSQEAIAKAGRARNAWLASDTIPKGAAP